jgi:mannose-6-phosphate isomerase-like protein (cupin superfamily)
MAIVIESTARPSRPQETGQGRSKSFGKPLIFSDAYFRRKVSSQDSDGDLCIYEVVRTKRGGPLLHYHQNQDEWFLIREGEFLFHVGNDNFRLVAGDSILARRKCRTPSLTSAREACLRSSITLPARWKNSFAKAVDCCCATRHPMNGKHYAAFTE